MSTDANGRVTLPEDVAGCHALIEQLVAQIHSTTRKIEQLEHYLARLLRQQYGRTSEKLDPKQGLLFELPGSPSDSSTEQVSTADEAPSLEVVVQAHQRRGGGRMKLPADLPRERIEQDLPEHEKACPCCGLKRERIGCETSEQLEFVPASLFVQEHVRWKYACRRCEEHVATAAVPAKPIDKGLPGSGLLAQLVVSKYGDHLPLYRLEDVFARHGVEIPRSTLCRWARSAADLLEPLYQEMIAQVRRSQILRTDDTPVKVLDDQLDRTRTGRFWTYLGDDEHPFTVYDYTPSRKRDGPQEFLQEFRGYLVADAFSGYEGIYVQGDVKQVLCWAHARRKFFEAQTTKPVEAAQALSFIARLYDLEREAKELASERRLKLRRMRSLPLLAQLHGWLKTVEPNVLPKSPLGEAIGYVLPRWEGFTRYCEDGALPIDNNASERALRGIAVGRKNWLFLGSDRGGKTAAVLFSLIATCKRHAIEPFAYLRDVLERLPSLSTNDVSKLLPPIWKQSHPSAHRPINR